MPKYLLGLCLLSGLAAGQGETTSAIAGQVVDQSNAGIPNTAVTIRNAENGLKRSVTADTAGRFNFPQLKPGIYRVSVEADGFETQQRDSVTAGLGQTQTVNFTLAVASARQAVVVSGEAPLVNTENPNTSTTMNAKALENLPNPGGDLTYPLQFAAGALINTAGSGNDFVGGTNGYGNVQFNGLPALANGYIVDGLETQRSADESEQRTFDQPGAGAELDRRGDRQHAFLRGGSGPIRGGAGELRHQVRDQSDFTGTCMSCGTDRGSMPRISSPTRHRAISKPRSTVNHFGGSLGGPIRRNKLFFFFDSEWVRIALPIVTAATVPTPAFQNYVLQQLAAGREGFDHRIELSTGSRSWCRFIRRCFRYTGNASGTPLAVLGCPFNSDGSAAAGNPPNGNGCANRQSVSHSSDDREQVQTGRIDYNIDEKNMTWFRFQADTGLQAAYTDPINPVFNAVSPQPLYSFAAGYTHVFSPHLVNYFNPAFSWYESLFGPQNLQQTLAAFPIVLQGIGANAPFTPLGGLDNTWVQGRRATRFFINDNLAWSRGRARAALRNQQPDFPAERLRFRRRDSSDGEIHGSAAVHLRRRVDCDGDLSVSGLAAVQVSEPGFLRAGHLEGDIEAHLDVRSARHV